MRAVRPDIDIERYADSLVNLGEATGSLARFKKDMETLLDMIEQSEEIRRFLADSFVNKRGKCRALEEVLEDKIHPALLHFFLILVEQELISRVKPVAMAFFEKASRLGKKASGEMVAAVPIPDGKVAEIEREVGRVVGKEVCLRVRVNPDILGGLLVQVDDFVLDGTVERQLEEMRRELAG